VRTGPKIIENELPTDRTEMGKYKSGFLAKNAELGWHKNSEHWVLVGFVLKQEREH